jgi:hypothetical protein
LYFSDLLNVNGATGTAMHYAFRHNRPVALRMLVERKANVTLFDAGM